MSERFDAMLQEMDDIERDAEALSGPAGSEQFYLARPIADWLHVVDAEAGVSPTDILNRAIYYAAHRQLAQKYRFQMVALRLDASPLELPAMVIPSLSEANGVSCTVNLTPINTAYLRWAQRERGLTSEVVAHDGVRIIGALAATNAFDGLEIQGGTEDEGVSLLGLHAIDLSAVPKLELDE